MQERKLTIVNRLGLHARAAVTRVRQSRYVSNVFMRNGRRANDVTHRDLRLSADGREVSIEVDGPDEVEATPP